MAPEDLQRLEIPFRLRDLTGHVAVEYGTNRDPSRWGYHLLGLGYEPDAARGFPVCRASVTYGGEGYAAAMAWIQIVRYRSEDDDMETVLVDTAPQLSDTGVPYYAWGTNPSFFDAPSTTRNVTIWSADTFLVASPDALMTRVVEPVCGFRWGYEIHDRDPEPLPLTLADPTSWPSARAVLRERYPAWEFGAGP
jgi:hypothetical protein